MPTDALEASRIPEPQRLVFDPGAIQDDLREIARFPDLLRKVVADASPQDLSRTWRDGSWTVAQLVHHVLDSHLHSYSRCKFALCETNPSIKPYDENIWVTTPDCTADSVEETLDMLGLLHRRWVRLLSGLDEASWRRSFHHPERKRDFVLYEQAGIYAWHGRHHLAQACVALGVALPD